MKTRILTGVIGGAFLIGAIWWHILAWQVLATVLAVVALAEIGKMSGIGRFNPLILTGYMLLIAALLADLPLSFILPFAIIVSILLSLRDHTLLHAEKVGLYVFSLLYILIAFHMSIQAYESNGKFFLLYIFFLIWASDTFAYFAGSLFGKHKLAPTLSPKKTIEGLVGGVVGTVVFAYLATGWLGIDYTTIESILFGLFVACFAPIGDLFESSMKRYYGVKDAGSVLPGHGGILDRFDSFLFVMMSIPLFFFFFGK